MTPTVENPLPAGLGDPLDVVLRTKCPLSEQLRDLQRETLGWDSFFLFFCQIFCLSLRRILDACKFLVEKKKEQRNVTNEPLRAKTLSAEQPTDFAFSGC